MIQISVALQNANNLGRSCKFPVNVRGEPVLFSLSDPKINLVSWLSISVWIRIKELYSSDVHGKVTT